MCHGVLTSSGGLQTSKPTSATSTSMAESLNSMWTPGLSLQPPSEADLTPSALVPSPPSTSTQPLLPVSPAQQPHYHHHFLNTQTLQILANVHVLFFSTLA